MPAKGHLASFAQRKGIGTMKRITCSCILIAACALGQVPMATAQSPAPGSTATQPPAIKIQLKSFAKEFIEQPVKACQKYKDQRVSFRGDIEYVSVNSDGTVMLVFSPEDEFSLLCLLSDSEKQKVDKRKLKTGDSVSVEGLCKGVKAGLGVRLYECIIK